MTEIGYQDERLADGTICRRFEDGRTEWRSRRPDERVDWRDATGAQGVDELLGDNIIKRQHQDGRAEYARDQGHGRTAWANDLLTVNRTLQAAPRPGSSLADMLNIKEDREDRRDFVPPPAALTAAEEEELRRRKAAKASGREIDVDSEGWGEDLDGDEGDGDFG